MSSDHILLETLAEILKRLPLRSILQFRSVSKQWKRLIDSPFFIAFYGVRRPQPHRFIVSSESSYAYNDYTHSTFVDQNDCFVEELFSDAIPRPPLPLFEGYPCIVGSSHGLLCYKKITCEKHTSYCKDCYNITEMVVLWNPSLRKSVSIPVPDSPNYNFEYRVGNYNFGDYGDDDVVGFGVCPVTYDPIILKIKRIDHQSETEDTPGISLPWRVGVFTLSTGTWSILSTALPRESIRLRGSQVIIDRFIYWAAFDMLDSEVGPSQSPFLIMSFDLITKEFKEINLEGSLTNRLCSIQTISNLHDSLVLIEYHKEVEEGEPVCCLWMMEKQGVNISFTKLYNINIPDATVKTLLGFWKTGEFILVTKEHQERNDAYLEIYNPNLEAIEGIGDYGFDGNDYSFFMCSYMESLLLVNQLDGYIYSINI